MKLFSKNEWDIHRIHSEFQEAKLLVDHSYQRRKVWNDEDRVRLIETILMNYVVPEVFFWEASRDPETGVALTHIVDGQQRITAIIDFINGEYALTTKYLLDDSIKERCGDKYFAELSEDDKNAIWGFNISIVNIDKSCNIETIKTMFYRLNLTDYNLNSQEKRNSKNSAFGDKCEALATMDFWNKVKAFSSNDAKRMKDVEYCCSIYILANEFIINQTDDKKVNDYYDDYSESFDCDNILLNKITLSMEHIESLLDKNTMTFISKKVQLYTLFSVFIKMIEDKENIDEHFVNMFKRFVRVYNKFRNDYAVSFDKADEQKIYEKIKKYKLASSEGVNKIVNRMLRYEVLYDFCTSKEIPEDAIQKVEDEFDSQKSIKANDNLDEEDLIEE